MSSKRMPTFNDHYGFDQDYSPINGSPLVTGDYVGVEVELENISPAARNSEPFQRKLAKHWSVHNDGSLRNNGIEFVFNKPKAGSDVTEALSDLEGALNLLKTKPICSDRTSVHVHVNMRDMTLDSLFRMSVSYMVFEPMIFKAYAPNRSNNIFCLPFNECNDNYRTLRLINGDKATIEKFLRQNFNRYCAYNLLALGKFSTVEFRHLSGTYSKEAIVEWINLILSLKKFGRESTDLHTDLFNKVNNKGPILTCYDIFPEAIAKRLIGSFDEEEFWSAVRVARSTLIDVDKVKVSNELAAAFKIPDPIDRVVKGEISLYDVLNRSRETILNGSTVVMVNPKDQEYHDRAKRHKKVNWYVTTEVWKRIYNTTRGMTSTQISMVKPEEVDWDTGEVKYIKKDEDAEKKPEKKAKPKVDNPFIGWADAPAEPAVNLNEVDWLGAPPPPDPVNLQGNAVFQVRWDEVGQPIVQMEPPRQAPRPARFVPAPAPSPAQRRNPGQPHLDAERAEAMNRAMLEFQVALRQNRRNNNI